MSGTPKSLSSAVSCVMSEILGTVLLTEKQGLVWVAMDDSINGRIGVFQ